LNIPLHELPYRLSEIKGLGKEPVVFYCRSGNRSGQAVSYLQQQGFGNIYNGGSLEEALAL
jgi:rhodanese-related sulfurtransferase